MTTAQNIKDILDGKMSLVSQRDAIKTQSYSDAFPGSQEWKNAKEYATALKEFDEKHPEIVAEIRAQQSAKKAKEQAEARELGWI